VDPNPLVRRKASPKAPKTAGGCACKGRSAGALPTSLCKARWTFATAAPVRHRSLPSGAARVGESAIALNRQSKHAVASFFCDGRLLGRVQRGLGGQEGKPYSRSNACRRGLGRSDGGPAL